jgi:hypothetical protein
MPPRFKLIKNNNFKCLAILAQANHYAQPKFLEKFRNPFSQNFETNNENRKWQGRGSRRYEGS